MQQEDLMFFTEQLPLGEEVYGDFVATARKKDLVALSRALKSVGDDIGVNYEEIKEEENKPRSFLGSVTRIVDTILDWLENSSGEVAKDEDFQKNECVLRGLCHFAAIGIYAYLFPLLKLICKSLDVPENPYKSKCMTIEENLKKAESKYGEIKNWLTQAGEILIEMTKEKGFNKTKAMEYDTILKKATIELESSQVNLKAAKKATLELIEVMTIMKWFSRGVRLSGWALTCFVLYQFKQKSSSLDKLEGIMSPDNLEIINKWFIGLFATSFYSLISFYPSRAYELLDTLNGLKDKHEVLEKELHILKKRLEEKKMVA